jgi:arsenate reductase-like glutaredoxin family protein
MTPNSEQVIETIQRLPASEQKKVLGWLEEHKTEIDEKLSEEELEQKVLKNLLAKGIISEIVEPMTDEEDDEFEPIEIEGEPLSEMIVRERR